MLGLGVGGLGPKPKTLNPRALPIEFGVQRRASPTEFGVQRAKA